MDRETARVLLSRLDSLLATRSGREARNEAVKLLNDSSPSYTWVGIYLLSAGDMILDAWSGPHQTSHTRIPAGKGVCGWVGKTGRTEIVSDVSKDPRYLECFPTTKSEIVVPIRSDGRVLGEIDIDSDTLNAFSTLDREFLEAFAARIAACCLN